MISKYLLVARIFVNFHSMLKYLFLFYLLPRAITGPILGSQTPLVLQMTRERPSTSWRSEADSNSWYVCRDKLDCSTTCDSSCPHDHEAIIFSIKYFLGLLRLKIKYIWINFSSFNEKIWNKNRIFRPTRSETKWKVYCRYISCVLRSSFEI